MAQGRVDGEWRYAPAAAAAEWNPAYYVRGMHMLPGVYVVVGSDTMGVTYASRTHDCTEGPAQDKNGGDELFISRQIHTKPVHREIILHRKKNTPCALFSKSDNLSFSRCMSAPSPGRAAARAPQAEKTGQPGPPPPPEIMIQSEKRRIFHSRKVLSTCRLSTSIKFSFLKLRMVAAKSGNI